MTIHRSQPWAAVTARAQQASVWPDRIIILENSYNVTVTAFAVTILVVTTALIGDKRYILSL